MVDLTTAVEIAAKGAYLEYDAKFPTKVPWENVDGFSKLAWRENALPYVTALHEAGMFKEDSDG